MSTNPPRTASPVWHPFTQHGLERDAILIARAEGAHLETADGRRLFDAISSWWVITHGHRNPRIIAAIKAQADTLDQLIFAGFTHAPAEQLARRLVAIAPAGLSHVFFSDSGSTSVEVAVKMALGARRHQGKPRTRILALDGGYHGDTIGGMSVGARGIFNAPYEPLLFEVGRIPFPTGGREQQTLEALTAACRQGGVAAFVVEPLVQGAGGMKIYPAEVLREMSRICAAHEVLLIADEVMTGFGRTGTLFACEQAGITPDILCLAKGLSGGALPLAATLCRQELFDAHLSIDRARTFFHSSSYTANPIACAAALANLDVWQDEPVRDRIATLATLQQQRLAALADKPCFSNRRQIGTIAALDVTVADAGYLADIGLRLRSRFERSGVLLRPLGNTIYLMPPYCTRAEDLDQAYAAIAEAVAIEAH